MRKDINPYLKAAEAEIADLYFNQKEYDSAYYYAKQLLTLCLMQMFIEPFILKHLNIEKIQWSWKMHLIKLSGLKIPHIR